MTNTLANKTILGASFWKFLLLFAALLFSYSSQALADENASDDFDIAAELQALEASLPSASEKDKEGIEGQISTLQYALDNDIPLSSGFTEGEDGAGDILSGYLGLSGGV
ncbi:MAG: hypothetical protein CMI29_04335, partial [Opitutae bacterium]|nr:hypothetical protein [Opitutae bacterium]